LNIVGIIPARMAASRFPNKPMAKICGVPMIGHVYFRSCMSSGINENWVATCDDVIIEYMHGVGGKAIMTSDSHQRASDRAAEAMLSIEKETGKTIDYVAMIQGDEPMLMPGMLNSLVESVLKGERPEVVNLITRIETEEDFINPNCVKVVFDKNMKALYFSREPIPSKKKFQGALPMWKQLGIILFSRSAMLKYSELEPTPLEIIESVDMNRFLEHGVEIQFVPTEIKSLGVDTPKDLIWVESQMENDPLVGEYKSKASMESSN